MIRAFNADKPYARFVQEQVAGDVLFPHREDGVEALGFIAAGPWDFIGHAELPETKIDGKIARHLDRDDMVANTCNTFLSLTVQCAQCHDHKFDPISQEDYYSLQAVFSVLDRADRAYYSDPAVGQRASTLRLRKRELEQKRQFHEQRLKKLGGRELEELDQAIGKIKEQDNEEALSLKVRRQQLLDRVIDAKMRQEKDELDRALSELEMDLSTLPPPRFVYAGTVHYGSGAFIGTGPGGGRTREIQVLARGDVTQPGKHVDPGALTALSGLPGRFELAKDHIEGERRAALANWLTHSNNPLTWRSIVNRIWLYHFGRGIVDTPSDFGRMGQLPTHPELLDWLAVEFRDNGQSFKALHRLIVTSATYRQTSNIHLVATPPVRRS